MDNSARKQEEEDHLFIPQKKTCNFVLSRYALIFLHGVPLKTAPVFVCALHSGKCDNKTVSLSPGVSHIIISDADCRWMITAPNGTLIEVNILTNTRPWIEISVGTGYNSPGINGSSDAVLFKITNGKLGIFYANISSIWILIRPPSDWYMYAARKIELAVRLTAFWRQGTTFKFNLQDYFEGSLL